MMSECSAMFVVAHGPFFFFFFWFELSFFFFTFR
jgi:hypothetical protein